MILFKRNLLGIWEMGQDSPKKSLVLKTDHYQDMVKLYTAHCTQTT